MSEQFNNEQESIDTTRRSAAKIAMSAGVLGAMGLGSLAHAAPKASKTVTKSPYAEPEQYGLERPGMIIDPKRVALVVDPQNDFLSPNGVMWGVLKDSIIENNTVENTETLFEAAKKWICPSSSRPTTITQLTTNGSLWHQAKTLCTKPICSLAKVHTVWTALKALERTLWNAISLIFLTAKPPFAHRTKSLALKPAMGVTA
ncbi:hypothetical protein [Moraxella bovis]|uniref:hypothetical protein n=1 Tax=Moraxella bovis TaxID=476 RepID=UPI002227AA94|nr:hypothetical protein [Moraxella bovis]UYZ96142.1 hypothetical protein LP121_06285 [Moraxella bovis]